MTMVCVGGGFLLANAASAESGGHRKLCNVFVDIAASSLTMGMADSNAR